MQRVPVRILFFILFTVSTFTLIEGASAQPPIPTPPLPPFISDLTVTPSELGLGDNVTIGLDVMNPNNRSITYIVTIRVEGIGRIGAEIEELTLFVDVELGAYESEAVQHTMTPDAAGDFNVTVDGMTGSFTVVFLETLLPAEFVLSELEVSPELEMGEYVIFTVLVVNTGETEGTHTVEFNIRRLDRQTLWDWETTDIQNVTLAAACGRHAISYFEPQSPGTYQVSVGNLTETFTVRAPLKPAEFEFSNLRIFYPGIIPPEVERGQTVTVTVSVEIENVGELEGGRTVELKVDGEAVDSKGVTLEGGASATVLFELTRGEGTHEVEVEGFTDSFTVNPKPSFWDKIPGFPYESITLGLIAVIIILWHARARSL